MTKSSLCTYTNLTSNRSTGRGGNKVCKITPHYMCAHWTGKQCADYFASTSRQASSNYCIGYNGDIAMSVDENNRAWTSSSGWNDRQAITIECANNSDSSLTTATWNSLVNLCVDICKRYGFRLSYTGNKNGSLTEHRMFASTDCPGAWLHANMSRLASEVNAILDGGSAPASNTGSTTGTTSSEHTGTGFGGTYTCMVDKLNVRDAPSLSGSVVASYSKGMTVTLDDWYKSADGYIWGRYTGASSGLKRYVAVGKPTGGVAADDFLIKGGTVSTSNGSGSRLTAGTYKVLVDKLNVRNGASTSAAVRASYSKGQTVRLDGTFKTADGYIWGRYLGGSGYYRWIAVQTTSGTKYAERV